MHFHTFMLWPPTRSYTNQNRSIMYVLNNFPYSLFYFYSAGPTPSLEKFSKFKLKLRSISSNLCNLRPLSSNWSWITELKRAKYLTQISIPNIRSFFHGNSLHNCMRREKFVFSTVSRGSEDMQCKVRPAGGREAEHCI